MEAVASDGWGSLTPVPTQGYMQSWFLDGGDGGTFFYQIHSATSQVPICWPLPF